MAKKQKPPQKTSEHSDVQPAASPKQKKLSSNNIFLWVKWILLRIKTFFKKNRFKILLFLIHIIPAVCIIWAIFIYATDPSSIENKIVAAVMGIINLSFFIFAVFLKKEEIKETTYTAYFTLMIFNVGIFPLFNYIKDYQERNKEEVKYTIGFRSWGTRVEYSNIKVFYYDRFGNPYAIHDSIINNYANWIPRLWTEMNIDNELELPYSSDTIKKGDKLIISLTNCGAVLNPKVFEKDKVSSFSVSADIRYLETDPRYVKEKKNERYESTQICLRVPYYVNSSDKKASESSKYKEIYYGFELPFWNFSWSKLRIPAFNFDYTETELYYRVMNNPNDQYARHIINGINKTIFRNELIDSIKPIDTLSTLKLSAMIIGNNASFYIYKEGSTHSLPLFNFRISDYSEIDLK